MVYFKLSSPSQALFLKKREREEMREGGRDGEGRKGGRKEGRREGKGREEI